jgi:hypothetical protein
MFAGAQRRGFDVAVDVADDAKAARRKNGVNRHAPDV